MARRAALTWKALTTGPDTQAFRLWYRRENGDGGSFKNHGES